MDTYVSTKEHHHTISMVNLRGWRRNEVRVQIYLLKVGKCIQNESKPDKSHHVKLVIVHSVERKTPHLDESVVQQKKSPKVIPTLKSKIDYTIAWQGIQVQNEVRQLNILKSPENRLMRSADFTLTHSGQPLSRTETEQGLKKGHATVTLYFSAYQNLKKINK